MHHLPEIAIIEPNTLTALGLRTILEELIPEAVIRTFSSFEKLIDDTPDMYAHYFVSANVYFEHTSFFWKENPSALCSPQEYPPTADRNPKPEHSSSTRTTGKNHHADPKTRTRATHHPVTPPATDAEHELSAREIEVLRLVTKGLINKEIADKLHISLTTVISHRKNITEKVGH